MIVGATAAGFTVSVAALLVLSPPCCYHHLNVEPLSAVVVTAVV